MWRKSETKPSAPAATPAAPPRSFEPVSPAPSAPASAYAAPAERREATRITQSISVKGEITGREDLFLDGEIHGSVKLTDANVTVGPNGRVNADIDAREIEVHGKVHGALRARERVRIGHSADVRGEISTQRIAIEDGAVFHGTVDIQRPGEARSPRREPAAATVPAKQPVVEPLAAVAAESAAEEPVQ
jgi:cytoskeletal protein CcmA (bactofilin family)